VDLSVRPVDGRAVLLGLESGDLDLAIIAYRLPDEPGLRQRKLLTEEFVCIARNDHPALGDTLDLDDFVALSHALISPTGQGVGVVDRALAAQGLKRRVALRVPHFLVAPLIVTHSDLIATVPRRVAEKLAAGLPLTLYDPPISIPSFDVWQVWHERQHHEPGGRWLRALAEAAVEAR
jgi:DNA-binding transcriptional LysR family regulator